MCGIAGIIYKGDSERKFSDFQRSFDLMKHRGPDFSGSYKKDNVGLYHHRLSIIDLSAASNQPYNTENNYVLSYNGEIYNYKDLGQVEGIHLQSDTSVLYNLLRKKGKKCVKDLNGIFAFAFLDIVEKKLMLARDRLGVKPLYYVNNSDFFAFSSEAKVLYDYLPSLTLNEQALHEYLYYGSTISDQNFVKEVYKIPPGSTLTVDLNNYQVKTESYWSLEVDILEAEKKNISYSKAKKDMRYLLEEAVKRQCISDVPVGAYLSGGIDSSVVVALGSRYTDKKLKTFSASFEGSSNSELPLAKEIAKKYNTEHYEFEVTTRGIEDELPNLIYQYDDPFADPAAIPLHLMAKKCKNKARVVLQGDGGDELFAGYGRHLDATQLAYRRVGYFLASLLHPSKAKRNSFKKRSKVANINEDWNRMAKYVSNTSPISVNRLLSDFIKKQVHSTDPFKKYRDVVTPLNNIGELQKVLYTDMQVILPYTFMEKVDKVNMYHNIEARVPLLDNALAEYVMKLPGDYKLRKETTKSMFREAVEDLLPSNILNGRKQSFGTPMGNWIKTILFSYIKERIHSPCEIVNKVLDTKNLQQMFDEHVNDQADHGDLLWRSSVLIDWIQFYKTKLTLDV